MFLYNLSTEWGGDDTSKSIIQGGFFLTGLTLILLSVGW